MGFSILNMWLWIQFSYFPKIFHLKKKKFLSQQKKENGEYLEVEIIKKDERIILHLVYSNTFKIPIIYFNVYDTQENTPKTW